MKSDFRMKIAEFYYVLVFLVIAAGSLYVRLKQPELTETQLLIAYWKPFAILVLSALLVHIISERLKK